MVDIQVDAKLTNDWWFAISYFHVTLVKLNKTTTRWAAGLRYQLEEGCKNSISRDYNPSYPFIKPLKGDLNVTPFIMIGAMGPPCREPSGGLHWTFGTLERAAGPPTARELWRHFLGAQKVAFGKGNGTPYL